jgi:glycolate oxidase iron-sulfur subunit
MAERNLEAFGLDNRPIVVNSAGCGAFLREYAEHFGRRFSSVAARVVDLSDFLADQDGLEMTGPVPEGPVAFHDPCHLRLAQGVMSAPRQLLSRLPFVELVELDSPDLCCGSAGVYNITNRRTGRELGRRKAEEIERSGARTVVTANPGCHLQIQGMLQSVGSDVRVRYLPELLRTAVPKPVRWEPATLPPRARDP